jgi:tetratricopeptide (TPR) repeat protein
LTDARAAQVDSPIYELVEGFPQPVLESLKLASFRDQVRNAAELKEQVALAQVKGLDALRKVEHELEPLADADSGVVIYLFRAYAAVEGWAEMIALVEQMSPPLAATAMVQEQFALALNRNEEPERALRVLHELLARRGPSSETYGILGRVHKDEWNRAKNRGEPTRARGELTKAIAAYVKGFETDWRDPYPGVNALTLMEAQDPPDPRSEVLLPVVEYAVERRIERGEPTYWDHATRLELAVLRRNEQRGGRALEDALAAVSDTFSPSTTANNLRIIREARAARGETVPWSDEAERELRAAAGDG